MKNENKRYFTQEGKVYDIFNLPKNFFRKGDLDLSDMDLKELPDLSTIKVHGVLDISRNGLTSLKGAPYYAYYFICSFNMLSGLQYCPKESKLIDCSWNRIKTLKWVPENLSYLICCHNDLIDLDGIKKLKHLKSLNCVANKLKTLNGAPYNLEKIECGFNYIESLVGGPKKILHYDCSHNPNLSNLGLEHIEECERMEISGTSAHKDLLELYGNTLRIKNGEIIPSHSR